MGKGTSAGLDRSGVADTWLWKSGPCSPLPQESCALGLNLLSSAYWTGRQIWGVLIILSSHHRCGLYNCQCQFRSGRLLHPLGLLVYWDHLHSSSGASAFQDILVQPEVIICPSLTLQSQAISEGSPGPCTSLRHQYVTYMGTWHDLHPVLVDPSFAPVGSSCNNLCPKVPCDGALCFRALHLGVVVAECKRCNTWESQCGCKPVQAPILVACGYCKLMQKQCSLLGIG